MFCVLGEKFNFFILNGSRAILIVRIGSANWDVLHDSKVQLCYNGYYETRNCKPVFRLEGFQSRMYGLQTFLLYVRFLNKEK